MKATLTLLLIAPMIVVGASSASAAECATTTEMANVEPGDTKPHVEGDLFDGYHGALVDAWTADGWNWRYKAYAFCGEGASSIVYRRDAGTEDVFRVFNKGAASSATARSQAAGSLS